MTKLIRREAMTRLVGSSAGALFGLTAIKASTSDRSELARHREGETSVVVVQATLGLSHAEGREMIGFIETGVAGGYALCTLTDQDTRNPVVQSVFAMPMELNGSVGVKVRISFFTEPVGDIRFALLHLPFELSGKRSTAAT